MPALEGGKLQLVAGLVSWGSVLSQQCGHELYLVDSVWGHLREEVRVVARSASYTTVRTANTL